MATMPRIPPTMTTQDRVDGERQVDQFDADDRRPEGAESHHRSGARRAPALLCILAAKVSVGQIQQVQPTEQLHQNQTNEIHGQQRGQHPKNKAADQAVLKRWLVLTARQPEHHDRHDQRVIGAEQPFKCHQRADGDEIPRLNTQNLLIVSRCSRFFLLASRFVFRFGSEFKVRGSGFGLQRSAFGVQVRAP
jgi:hypothetical protein